MKVKHELFKNVGIFTVSGDINSDHEDNLKLLLMKVVHSANRSVLNFRGVNRINHNCLKLLNNAYCTSLRLKNPLIMTEVPQTYLTEIFNCSPVVNSDFVVLNDKTEQDSGKAGVLSGVN